MASTTRVSDTAITIWNSYADLSLLGTLCMSSKLKKWMGTDLHLREVHIRFFSVARIQTSFREGSRALGVLSEVGEAAFKFSLGTLQNW